MSRSPRSGAPRNASSPPSTQGGFVEFTLDEQGKYAVVTHKFANPGKGALGFFQAGEPLGAQAGGH